MPKRLRLCVALGALIVAFALAPLTLGRRVLSAETMLDIDHPLTLTASIPVDALARQREGGRPISLKVSLVIANYARKTGDEDTLLRILAGGDAPKPAETEPRTLGLMSLSGSHRPKSATQRFQILLELPDAALTSVERNTGALALLPLLILIEPMSGQRALTIAEATAEVVAP